MSARRYSSPLRSSREEDSKNSPPKNPDPVRSKKTDLNLDEVVKPGSVPFIWEQIPGKAKGGNDSRIQSPQDFPTIPKLPPGKKSGELNGFRTPNKLSGELGILRPPNKLSGELNVLRPNKFSGEINTLRPYSKLSGELKTLSGKFYSSNNMARWDNPKGTIIMNESTESEEEDHDDDDDATFSDAIESFSVNCSVSGLSQLEHLETKFPENLPRDPKARDFMLNRFLPAAKAMTLEPIQYASRKQIVAVDQHKEVKALVPRAMTPPPNPSMCKIVPYTGQDIGSEESEEEEDSYVESSSITVKVKACGFLPWFCSKNSLRLANPLPSMKDRSKSALSSASKLSKLIKSGSWRSSSQKLVKDPYNNPKQKVTQVYKSCELQKLPKYTPKPMFYSGELQTRSGSPYRSSRRSNVSPFRNESPHSLYSRRVDSFDENRSKVSPKGSNRFEEPGNKKRVSRSRTWVEDSVNITKVSHSILNLPKTKTRVDSSVEDAVRLEYGGRLALLKARGKSGPLVSREVDALEPSRSLENGNTNTCRELVVVSSSDETSTVQSSLTPPLPKSPSESWLSRQMPSVSPRVSPRNSVSYSSMNSKVLSRKQSDKSPTSGAKWENIVKSSHLRQDHGRYSEELVTHVSQQARIWK